MDFIYGFVVGGITIAALRLFTDLREIAREERLKKQLNEGFRVMPAPNSPDA